MHLKIAIVVYLLIFNVRSRFFSCGDYNCIPTPDHEFKARLEQQGMKFPSVYRNSVTRYILPEGWGFLEEVCNGDAITYLLNENGRSIFEFSYNIRELNSKKLNTTKYDLRGGYWLMKDVYIDDGLQKIKQEYNNIRLVDTSIYCQSLYDIKSSEVEDLYKGCLELKYKYFRLTCKIFWMYKKLGYNNIPVNSPPEKLFLHEALADNCINYIRDYFCITNYWIE